MAGVAQDAPGRQPHGEKGQSLAAHLRQIIYSGRFAPGQRLIEADLTGEMGVGRGLMREALRLLAAEGLVELVPNRGAMVRRLSRCEALELFEIRTELEAFAARRAATLMHDSHARHAFKRAIAPIRDERPRLGFDAYIAENELFHRAILEAAGNRQLIEVHQKLQLALILSQIRFAIGTDMLASSVDEHRIIARAITLGDASGAEQAIRAHLGRASAFVRQMPDDAFRPAPRHSPETETGALRP